MKSKSLRIPGKLFSLTGETSGLVVVRARSKGEGFVCN